MAHAEVERSAGILVTLPQRRPQVGVEADEQAMLFCQFHRAHGGAAHRLVGHAQRAKVEQPGPSDHLLAHFVSRQHHVRAGGAVEGEIPVAVGQPVHQGQRGGYTVIHAQTSRVDSLLGEGIAQQLTKAVIAHLADERRGMPQLAQHGQHIAGRTAGIGFKHQVALTADAVLREVDQQFAQGDHIMIHSPSSSIMSISWLSKV